MHGVFLSPIGCSRNLYTPARYSLKFPRKYYANKVMYNPFNKELFAGCCVANLVGKRSTIMTTSLELYLLTANFW